MSPLNQEAFLIAQRPSGQNMRRNCKWKQVESWWEASTDMQFSDAMFHDPSKPGTHRVNAVCYSKAEKGMGDTEPELQLFWISVLIISVPNILGFLLNIWHVLIFSRKLRIVPV